jgi:hypothetical protein
LLSCGSDWQQPPHLKDHTSTSFLQFMINLLSMTMSVSNDTDRWLLIFLSA